MRLAPMWLLLLFAVLSGCGAPEVERLIIGAPAPEFTLRALDGTSVASTALAGEMVVLNFWATWCQPCLKEIPELKELAGDRRVQVVGIALDEEGAAAVGPFVERHRINYTVLLGNQEIFQRFNGFSIPYTLVLDRSRQVVNIYRGPTTRADIEQDLKSLGQET